MVVNISEEEQRQYFINWWNESDTKLICEVPVFCRSVDLVKYNKMENTVSAVEFKTRNWKRAIQQVLSTAISFDYIEICIQKPRTEKAQQAVIDFCLEEGVGLYFFDVHTFNFEYAVIPKKVNKIWDIQKTQVINFIVEGEKYAR